jgi:hypothetical protein
MRELLTELRLKDYITIGLILLAVFVIMNLQNFISAKLPKINLNEYDTELQAKIKGVKPIHRKSETLEGSKLTKTGYNIDLEFYYPDSIKVNNTMVVKYNSYEANKSTIDNMILNEEGILSIRIKKNEPNKMVLNYILNE